AAHVAGREGGVQHGPLVIPRRQSAGVLDAVHLGVENGAPFLHAAIVAAPDDAAVDDQDGADRDPAFREALLGLVERGLQERVHATNSSAGRCREGPWPAEQGGLRRIGLTVSYEGLAC